MGSILDRDDDSHDVARADLLANESFKLDPTIKYDIAGSGTPVSKENVPAKALKFDEGKVDWGLVPFEALEGMVRVLEFGAKKYAEGNWAENGGLGKRRLLNSLCRHVFAYMKGEDLDPESGLPHTSHAQCNLLFLSYYILYPSKFPLDGRLVHNA